MFRMQETEIPDNNVSEMPAPSVMITSPQFNRVLEQMGDFGETINNGVKKKATCTTCTWKSMPLIEVTCFDDEAYNKKIQNEYAPAMETKETATANETSIIENSAAQENNESEVSADNSGNDENALVSNATSHGEQNSWVEKNTDGHVLAIKTNITRKCSKGLVVSSPQSPNRTTNQTKIETNGKETKNQFTSPEELKSSEPSKTPRKPDSRHSYVLASPSARRRRYTVCSFSSENGSSNAPQNNSELNNQETKLGVAAQNVSRSSKLGDRKLSSEILNDKKKPERIDLSFKVDSLANDSQQSNGLRKRSRTYEGKTQNPRQATSAVKRSSSEEHFLLGDFRMQHDNRRSSDGSPSPSVGKSLRETFQTQESKESVGISKSSLIVSDAAVVSSSDDRSLSTRRGSTLPLHGAKSASKGVNEKQSLSQVDVTQRLNLSPPRRRRVHTPKPPQDDKQSHLGVSMNSTRRKSETDLRKLVSEEEEAEKQRQVCLSTRQRVSRGSDTKPGEKKTSLGVSGRVSLSRSETDLGELVSDEERADAKKPSLSCPQRVRKPSSHKPMAIPETFSSTSSPVSPHAERKIYLAAAKPAARLPIRAKVRNDLAASSQIIIDQAEKELDHCSERLPHISIEEVLKSWHTDSKHWNVVSSLVKSNSDCAPKTNMDGVKNCRYIRDGVLRKKKKSH